MVGMAIPDAECRHGALLPHGHCHRAPAHGAPDADIYSNADSHSNASADGYARFCLDSDASAYLRSIPNADSRSHSCAHGYAFPRTNADSHANANADIHSNSYSYSRPGGPL